MLYSIHSVSIPSVFSCTGDVIFAVLDVRELDVTQEEMELVLTIQVKRYKYGDCEHIDNIASLTRGERRCSPLLSFL